ncbi:hypothetical protein VTK73DRAFT_7776 [Phialemonium thermophilum]|uniref:Uncharacterized protein n=1 Tax=Phialemonium thermophilum TaxID=223376 RepID=A0ABR3XRL6_9PEZI
MPNEIIADLARQVLEYSMNRYLNSNRKDKGEGRKEDDGKQTSPTANGSPRDGQSSKERNHRDHGGDTSPERKRDSREPDSDQSRKNQTQQRRRSESRGQRRSSGSSHRSRGDRKDESPGMDPASRGAFGGEQASELVGHLLRGAAVLAARQFVRAREKKKKTRRQEKAATAPWRKAAAGVGIAAAGGGLAMADGRGTGGGSGRTVDGGRHHEYHRSYQPRGREKPQGGRPAAEVPKSKEEQDRAELVLALDGLLVELGTTAARIQELAGRSPRCGRAERRGSNYASVVANAHGVGSGEPRICEVHRQLVASADGLQASIANLQTGVNNIRNLHSETLAAAPRARARGTYVQDTVEGRDARRKRTRGEMSGSKWQTRDRRRDYFSREPRKSYPLERGPLGGPERERDIRRERRRREREREERAWERQRELNRIRERERHWHHHHRRYERDDTMERRPRRDERRRPRRWRIF